MSLINDALKRASEAQQRQPRQPKMPPEIMRPVDPPAPASGGPRAVLWCVAFVVVFGLGAWFLWQGWQAGRKQVEVAQTTPPKPATTVKTNAIAAAPPAMPAKAPPVEVKSASLPPVPTKPTPPVETKAPTLTNTPPAPATKASPVETTAPVPTPKPAVAVATPLPPAVTVPPTPAEVTPIPPAKTAIVPNITPVTTNPVVVAPSAVIAPAGIKPLSLIPPALKPAVAAKPPGPEAPFPVLKLQGIIYLPSKPSAIISGRTVYAGDKLEDVRIVRVERESVLLEFRGRTNTLHLLR